MKEKTQVTICLGSSCFARGNKSTLKAVTQFIQKNNLQESITFRGGHCFGSCAEGPILKVGETIHTGVDEFKALEILSNHFIG